LDSQAKIYLFGSRIDDDSRGGDIDLLILSEVITERHRRHIRIAIFERLGEQKLDLIIAKDLSQPFVRMAYNRGILL
jgi:predicted nucleotidyltransferase